MSEPKLISPMLDGFAMGEPIRDHNGVRCCPAMNNASGDKYIVKIISTPASQTQLEALILSGAFPDKESALEYYRGVTDSIVEEITVLQKLSQLEGFLTLENHQVEAMDDGNGFDLYMLSKYRNTLDQKLRHGSLTQLEAVNLALDMCAALSVCRRSGYLYVNLKPENIYLSDDKGYRIGDVGFMKLNSLKYASLPDRYRSSYTAPEIEDAYASLNTTLDIYALGLVLYQVYNDGTLPTQDSQQDGNFAPPAYADYEMAEIILKACAQNPENRWQDPVEMGQALVGYMQRNGANDTSITPVLENVTENVEMQELAEPAQAEIAPEDITEDLIYTEDEEGNLTYLEDETSDETAPEEIDETIAEVAVSDEVNEILNQADDLLAHPTPDPVVQPEPIDVPVPEPVPAEEETADEPQADTGEENIIDDAETAEESNTEEAVQAETSTDEVNDDDKPAKKSHWLRNMLLCLLFLALIAGGFFFYTRYYIQPIESIVLQEGLNCSITVNVNSKLDESKLTVICSDTYGNQLKQPVKNGKAVFNDLAPNAAYTINVVVDGFHKLTGDTSTAFTTPVQTNVVQLNAVTGSEDGSAIVGFTIEGPDAKQWNIEYSAADEPAQTVTFAGHMTTLTGLTVGKEYTIKLSPDDDLLITGISEINHTASALVKPRNLKIKGLVDNKLTATWSAPENVTVESWTVRCYSGTEFDQTLVVSECSATFEGVDPTKEYTVEVTAAGMSVSERAFVPANSITVTNFIARVKSNALALTWKCVGTAPQGGWVILYTMDGSPVQELTCEEGTSATIPVLIPGSNYTVTLQTADGVAALGGTINFNIKEADDFSEYNVTKSKMTFKMCKTPSKKNWDRYDLSSDDYTTTFETGEKASFLIKLSKSPKSSSDKVTTLFVIRDESGNIVSTATTTEKWKNMWSNKYCELDVPSLPQVAGKYNIRIYFDGGFVHEQDFNIAD
ncbi:MAG: fibronectin type III domain-containing protein [Oscillospiraceae bacterium]|nr:fibronectin type III domain-containing protein [Oscillospiraceae bacterium]